MKIKKMRTKATIELQSEAEIYQFELVIQNYMDMIYEPQDEDGEQNEGDVIARELAEKFIDWSEEV